LNILSLNHLNRCKCGRHSRNNVTELWDTLFALQSNIFFSLAHSGTIGLSGQNVLRRATAVVELEFVRALAVFQELKVASATRTNSISVKRRYICTDGVMWIIVV